VNFSRSVYVYISTKVKGMDKYYIILLIYVVAYAFSRVVRPYVEK